MKCITIDSVKTNLDSYAESKDSPQQCRFSQDDDVVADFEEACKYYFTDEDTGDDVLIQSEYCECSLMEEIEPDADDEEEPPLIFYDQIEQGIEPIPRKKIEKGTGYCPIPSQEELNRFIGNFVTMAEKAPEIIHTNDRLNMKAYYEKLVDTSQIPDAPIKNETWADVVETQFQIEYWPFVQSNQTKTCVNAVMTTSPMNLFKVGANMGLSVSILALLIFN